MPRPVRYRELDWVLLALVVLISLLGVLEIYSTTQNNPRFAGMHLRQLYWLGIGVVLLFVLARIDYHSWTDQAPLLYIGILAGLVVVALWRRQQPVPELEDKVL